MLNCPLCYSRAIGKVGNDQYYCWDCYIEFVDNGYKMEVFDIGEDGSLISVTPEEINY